MILRLAFLSALGVALLGEPALAAKRPLAARRPLFVRAVMTSALPETPNFALFEWESGTRAVVLTAVVGFLIYGRRRVLARPARTVSPEATLEFDYFESESAARAFRPSGTVVWMNMKTGVFHERGAPWYGRTRDGAYVSLADAAAFVVRGRPPSRPH